MDPSIGLLLPQVECIHFYRATSVQWQDLSIPLSVTRQYIGTVS